MNTNTQNVAPIPTLEEIVATMLENNPDRLTIVVNEQQKELYAAAVDLVQMYHEIGYSRSFAKWSAVSNAAAQALVAVLMRDLLSEEATDQTLEKVLQEIDGVFAPDGVVYNTTPERYLSTIPANNLFIKSFLTMIYREKNSCDDTMSITVDIVASVFGGWAEYCEQQEKLEDVS